MVHLDPRRLKHGGAALAACLLLSVACSRQQNLEPLVEEVAMGNLHAEAEAALAHLQAARERLPSCTGEPADELAASETALNRLIDYYLPLLEARELAVAAYRLHAFGDRQRAGKDLDSIETILLAMAGKRAHLALEVESSLDLIAEARAALAAAREDAPRLLLSLANRLNLMIIKGGLVLQKQRP